MVILIKNILNLFVPDDADGNIVRAMDMPFFTLCYLLNIIPKLNNNFM